MKVIEERIQAKEMKDVWIRILEQRAEGRKQLYNTTSPPKRKLPFNLKVKFIWKRHLDF